MLFLLLTKADSHHSDTFRINLHGVVGYHPIYNDNGNTDSTKLYCAAHAFEVIESCHEIDEQIQMVEEQEAEERSKSVPGFLKD
jgi:hypothetical protein